MHVGEAGSGSFKKSVMSLQKKVESTQPPTVVCKNGSSVGMRTRCVRVFFGTFWRPICMLSRLLSNKISASELRRKFIKSALLVGWVANLLIAACNPKSRIQLQLIERKEGEEKKKIFLFSSLKKKKNQPRKQKMKPTSRETIGKSTYG